MTHTCKCGHEIKTTATLDGKVEHLPNGGHKYTVSISVGGYKGFGNA